MLCVLKPLINMLGQVGDEIWAVTREKCQGALVGCGVKARSKRSELESLG